MEAQGDLTGFTIAGRYRIVGRRGAPIVAGETPRGMYEAEDVRLGFPVALRLTPLNDMVEPGTTSRKSVGDARRAIQHHLRVAMSTQSPALAPISDWGDTDIFGVRCIYTVLGQLPGGSLREMFDRNRRLTPSQALVVGLDMCRGLSAMHQVGWVHGDIRPASIVFDANRRARVGAIDVLTRETIGDSELERARYAAPEVGQGEAPSEKSDIYSLALVLVEALTGELPFAGDSVAGVLSARVDKLLPVSADLGPLASVLERAARPDPESRFTAREFGEGLVAIARKVARPTPIDVVGICFDELLSPLPVAALPVIDQGDAGEPTGGIARAAQPEPVVVPSEELAQEIARAKQSRKRASKYVAVAIVLALLGGVGAGYMLLRKESFQVPVLVGLPEGEARNAISNFKWDVVIREGRSDQVKTGEVISSEPGDGVMLKEDQSIVLTVSQGPTFSTLEDFTNVASTDALARLDQLGLVANVAKENDEAVAAGTVMSWAVAEQPTAQAGDQVVKGTTITLNVSDGPVPRVLPTLVGLTTAEAEAKITELGLVFAVIEEDFNKEVGAGLVGGQLPAAGESLPRGGSVSYWVSKGPRLVAMPVIIGQYKAAIAKLLSDAGFVYGTESGKPERKLKSATIAGEPVGNGKEVPEGSTVDLTYYG